MGGSWCNLGSSITAEIAGAAGLDWILVDLEHGAGTMADLVHQFQGIGCTDAAPIVRIAANETPRFKRVLDMGAAGVMVPYVSTPDEAAAAVAAMRFPPAGIRGVAKLNRATRFGSAFEEYAGSANENLLLIVQIETVDAVKNADKIASIDGVDVLFIGPLDLSTNLGIQAQYDHPDFRSARQRVVEAARNAGKAAGILLLGHDGAGGVVFEGFSFLAVGSDSGMVVAGMKQNVELFERLKST